MCLQTIIRPKCDVWITSYFLSQDGKMHFAYTPGNLHFVYNITIWVHTHHLYTCIIFIISVTKFLLCNLRSLRCRLRNSNSPFLSTLASPRLRLPGCSWNLHILLANKKRWLRGACRRRRACHIHMNDYDRKSCNLTM